MCFEGPALCLFPATNHMRHNRPRRRLNFPKSSLSKCATRSAAGADLPAQWISTNFTGRDDAVSAHALLRRARCAAKRVRPNNPRCRYLPVRIGARQRGWAGEFDELEDNNSELVERIFNVLDTDSSGPIDFREFVSG